MFLAFVAFAMMFVNNYGVKADDGEDRGCADIEPGWCINTDIIDVDVCPDNTGLWCVAIQTIKEPWDILGQFSLNSAGAVVYSQEQPREEQVTVEVKKYHVEFPYDIEFWLNGEPSQYNSAEKFDHASRGELISGVVRLADQNKGTIDLHEGAIEIRGFEWRQRVRTLAYTINKNQIVLKSETKETDGLSACMIAALIIFSVPFFFAGTWAMTRKSLLRIFRAQGMSPKKIYDLKMPKSWMHSTIAFPMHHAAPRVLFGICMSFLCLAFVADIVDNNLLVAISFGLATVSLIVSLVSVFFHEKLYSYTASNIDRYYVSFTLTLAFVAAELLLLKRLSDHHVFLVFLVSPIAFYIGGMLTGSFRRWWSWQFTRKITTVPIPTPVK